MSIPPSSIDLPMPRWIYVPGESDQAEADQDALWQAKALVPSRFCDYVPARHPALRYGIALNDSGYFWESQAVLEAVWAAAPPGRTRADAAASLHSRRQSQSQAPGWEASCGRAAVRRSLERARSAGRAKGDHCRRRVRRGIPDRGAGQAAEGETGARDAVEGRLDPHCSDGPNMNKNAGFVSCGDWTEDLI